MVGHDVFRPENFLLVCKDTVGLMPASIQKR